LERRATAGYEFLGAKRSQRIEGSRPFLELGVARVDAGVVLDEIARKADLLRGDPGDRVAARMARADVHDSHLEATEEQRQLALEHEGRPGQAGNRLDRPEQAREALDLGLHVGLATLLDHLEGAA